MKNQVRGKAERQNRKTDKECGSTIYRRKFTCAINTKKICHYTFNIRTDIWIKRFREGGILKWQSWIKNNKVRKVAGKWTFSNAGGWVCVWWSVPQSKKCVCFDLASLFLGIECPRTFTNIRKSTERSSALSLWQQEVGNKCVRRTHKGIHLQSWYHTWSSKWNKLFPPKRDLVSRGTLNVMITCSMKW